MGPETPQRCLVTGATGYIGGRLVPELLATGCSRTLPGPLPGKLRATAGPSGPSRCARDVTDEASVRPAMDGVDVAYYLVHALGTGRDFEDTDRRAAHRLRAAARAAGVRRIVYLGGLNPPGVPEQDLSPHLRSRARGRRASCWPPACRPRCCGPP